MKRFIILLVVCSLSLSLIACDATLESELNNSSTSNTSLVSQDSSSPSDETASSSEVLSSESSTINSISDPVEDSTTENPEDESEITNPSAEDVIQKNIDGISVIVIGESQLQARGFKLNEAVNLSVSVTVEGERSVLDKLDSDKISASVNISKINESGTVQCVIDYSCPDGVKITSRSQSIANVSVKQISGEITPPAEEDVRIVNNVLISGTRAMEQFYGSSSGGQKTAGILNDFKKTMGDVNVYVLPAPLASAFYAPAGYEASIKNHQNCFYGMRDALENVGFVDTLSAISAHVDEEIYFRTDHHWQALAAYYACEELATVAGVSFDKLSTFSIKSEDGVLGSFYTTYTKDAVLGSNPDTMVWYEPTREYTVEYYSREGHSGDPITGRTLFSSNNGYTKFIYGDSYTTHVKTNVGNGRKLLLFKDSYGNALTPFLIGSFDEIIVADYRYFQTDVSDFISEQGITDVCFSIAAFGVSNFKGLKINY